MTSDFAWEVAKYHKSSPKPQNFWCVRAYCFAALVLQLICHGDGMHCYRNLLSVIYGYRINS